MSKQLKKLIEILKYHAWTMVFTSRITAITGCANDAPRELQFWKFKPEHPLWDWKVYAPEEAAEESLGIKDLNK